MQASRAPYLVLGVDPGLKGALALINAPAKKLECVLDMPTKTYQTKAGREHTIIDQTALALWLGSYSKQIALAVVEEVHSMPDQGVATTFKFGYNAGLVAGMISSTLVPIQFIPPQVWKALMNLSRNKRDSLNKAQILFPTDENLFKRAKDDGRAEAALLAYIGATRLL